MKKVFSRKCLKKNIFLCLVWHVKKGNSLEIPPKRFFTWFYTNTFPEFLTKTTCFFLSFSHFFSYIKNIKINNNLLNPENSHVFTDGNTFDCFSQTFLPPVLSNCHKTEDRLRKWISRQTKVLHLLFILSDLCSSLLLDFDTRWRWCASYKASHSLYSRIYRTET